MLCSFIKGFIFVCLLALLDRYTNGLCKYDRGNSETGGPGRSSERVPLLARLLI